MPFMVKVVEFSTAVANSNPQQWERQARFVLVRGQVHTVSAADEATREEVAALVEEISLASGTTPEDGDAFLRAVAHYDEGNRFARVSPILEMTPADAASTDGLCSVTEDGEAEEPVMELIGRVREAVRTAVG
jgi:hypothetical protein